jgi:hypothetical protein
MFVEHRCVEVFIIYSLYTSILTEEFPCLKRDSSSQIDGKYKLVDFYFKEKQFSLIGTSNVGKTVTSN